MSTNTPLFSIIIPARNEEQLLPVCISALRKAAHANSHSIELIVVINRCTDQTESIAESFNCTIVHDESKNLAQIRNAGVKASRGKIIVTVDADSVVSDNIFDVILEELNTNTVIGGGVMIYPERLSAGILASGLILLPIVLWHRIFCGLFFCYREDFFAIGGFDESLASVEDIDFAKRLRAYGKTINKKFQMIFRAYITTSCRKFDRFGDWYFVLHPWKTLSLLRGRNQALADKVWYDFEH